MKEVKIYRDKKGGRTCLGRSSRIRKRVYWGNIKKSSNDEGAPSASRRKIGSASTSSSAANDEHSYRILSFLSVFSAVSSYVKCKTCDSDVQFSETKVRGLGFKIVLNCGKCDNREIPSCPMIRSFSYEINHRIVLAMRVIGIGLAGLQQFCGIMDMPKPISQHPYDTIIKYIRNATEVVAKGSMFRAAQEEIDRTAENDKEKFGGITVSGDGTWRKRGFSSLFGVFHSYRKLDWKSNRRDREMCVLQNL